LGFGFVCVVRVVGVPPLHVFQVPEDFVVGEDGGLCFEDLWRMFSGVCVVRRWCPMSSGSGMYLHR